ncbi:MAG: TIR domain-containing protein [Parasphingorhabdus sp.]|nr:TIR domain-containing protein [Parasphingorhabdus sp.]
MTEFRYKAFVSYSWGDAKWGKWAHHALETYRTPKALIGKDGLYGPVAPRLHPLFKDREEEAAGSSIGTAIEDALASSEFLIVICSPRSAQSKWVNHEIAWFKTHRDPAKILALIVDGEPGAAQMPGREKEECFPKALTHRIGPDLFVTDEIEAHPLAADARSRGDGKRVAKLKLAAAMLGVGLDEIVRRDDRRRLVRSRIITGAALSLALVMSGLTLLAVQARNEAQEQRRVAVQQRELADRSLDFLIGTFEIANPATENPRTITALTILDRASKNAESEFKRDPQISARLLRATGDIYYNLGLQKESERDLRQALALQPGRSEGRAQTLLKLAALAKRRRDIAATEGLVDQAEKAYHQGDATLHSLNAQVADQRANIAFMRADYGAATALYGSAANLYRRLEGDHREELAAALMSQATALVITKNFNAADRLFSEAIDISVARFGTNDVRTARAIHNQAYANFEAGRSAEAARMMPKSIAILEKVLEPNHPNQIAAKAAVGTVFIQPNGNGSERNFWHSTERVA